MKLTQKDFYIVVEDEKDDPKDFSAYLIKNYAYIEGKNVVIDLLKYGKLTLDELLSFLKLSDKHRANKYSFVIANDAINIDRVPEELVLAPTLPEAVDIIKMEEIERDLDAAF